VADRLRHPREDARQNKELGRFRAAQSARKWTSLARTSSFRLTLLYAGVFSLSVVLLLGIVAISASRFMARQIDTTVANELAEVQADGEGAGSTALRPIIEQLTIRSPGIYYLLQDARGRVLAGNMPAISPEPGLRVFRHLSQADGHAAGGIRGRGVVLPDGSYLFVGLSDFELGEMQSVILRAALAGLASTVVLAVAGGLVTSLGVLRRIETISQTSRDIMAGDLGRRIALSGTNDEFDHLAISLNAMLDRIQTLMRDLQQVSSDIAHDLRTPLTRLRQRLELARRRENDIDKLREALDGSIYDAEAILDTFSALLRIAQIESGARRSGFAPVDLTALLSELVEAYQPVAEERAQTLTGAIASDLRVNGDRELLAQLFANLIENAIRHTPASTTLTVDASACPSGIIAAVRDNGPGIPPELRSKVLQRFYRLEASRTTPGSGLGLSLVSAIAGLHEAQLELLDNKPGLACVVSFWTAR
jgi:signal transduction histidine kinase